MNSRILDCHSTAAIEAVPSPTFRLFARNPTSYKVTQAALITITLMPPPSHVVQSLRLLPRLNLILEGLAQVSDLAM
jgi:hypothetical protein